ncbi:hypothetical protein CKAN_02717800 [Cinnamomum micranthum f. kanehirae]|uniref:Uncharacterized protein n=1 Tax=Cinnamomum micranthum f. kanehirae TaxID=337451 RepID=A0A443Q3X0_9MAGN|nr:hypothetical protein CKAN_02717800 [Cinnamomum micranthum f. kanehirae]
MAAYRKSIHKSLLTIAGMAVLVGRWHSTQDPRMKPHRASLHYVERTIIGLDTPIAKGTYSEP